MTDLLQRITRSRIYSPKNFVLATGTNENQKRVSEKKRIR